MTSSQMGMRRMLSKIEDIGISDLRWIHRILVAEEDTCHSSTECFSA